MKPNKHKFFALSLLLFFCFTLYAQETITITLVVDTANFNSENPSSSCSMRAEYSSSGRIINSVGNLEEFTVEANVNDEIVWEGISSSSESDIIDIKKIGRSNNSKIFKDKINRGKKHGNSNKESVKATVLFNTKNKPDYKYDIFFKINHSGKNYKIDPKIKVGSS